MPVVQDSVVNGVSRPTVVRTSYGEITLSADGASSTQERDDLLVVMDNLFRHSDNIKLFKNLEFYW